MSAPDLDPEALAVDIILSATRAGVTVATAESLTAGTVAAALGGVAGASAVLQGGIVAYQAGVKQRLLGVDPELLAAEGAVDPEVAAQMAVAARSIFAADIGVSTTGVAGPAAHEGKPVGTVFTAISTSEGTRTFAHAFAGDRQMIRNATRDALLRELLGELSRGTNGRRG